MNTILLTLTLAAPNGAKIHIDGDGYLRFARGSQAVYSADALLIPSQGVLATPEGYPLLPQIHVPSGTQSLKIDIDGTVTANGKIIGRIVLVSFGGLSLQKSGAYYLGSGRSSLGLPGEGVFGIVRTVGRNPRSLANTSEAPSVQEKKQSAISIDVALHSDTTGDQILIKDIATVDGQGADQIGGVSLGTTPIFGAVRGITRAYIVAKLKNSGFDADAMSISCPAGASVSRKGQKLNVSAMSDAAVDAVKAKYGADGSYRLDKEISEQWIPTGKVTYNAKSVQETTDGATVDMVVELDGQEAFRRNLNLISNLPIPMVHINDPIKIRLVRNGAVVEIAGTARSTARVGGSISVRTELGASFTGILISTSLVEVKI